MKTFYIKKSTIRLFIIIIFICVFDVLFLYIKSDDIEYSEHDILLIEKYNEKKLLALTFDDGPSSYTKELLEILKENNVKASFFVLGENVIGRSDILLKEKNNGHLIGIHSYKHVFFTKISKEDVLEQITSTKNIIYEITETLPSYIRVPYGITNNSVNKILKEQDLENILWTVDSLDWSYRNTQKIVEHVIETTSGNDIILMHDIYSTSVEAAKEIITFYKEKGYEFVTVYDFYRIKNIANSIS